MKPALNLLVISSASAALLMACGKAPAPESMLEPVAPAGWADVATGFVNTSGEDNGYIAVKEAPMGGVMMRIDLKGLTRGWHGIHLHQIGDCSDTDAGFKASGGHVNPDGNKHGLLNPEGAERADLPNVYADGNGRATAELFASGLSLSGGGGGTIESELYNLMDADGFAVVVHESADDHLSQPIGGAGARVACAAFGGGEE